MLLTSYPYLNIYLHEAPSRAIEAQWRGFVSGSYLREAIQEALHLAQKHQVSGWIADDRLLGPLLPVDLEWAPSHAIPTMADLGIKRFAMVEAHDPLNLLLIESVYTSALTASPMVMRRFNDLEAARAWACSS